MLRFRLMVYAQYVQCTLTARFDGYERKLRWFKVFLRTHIADRKGMSSASARSTRENK